MPFVLIGVTANLFAVTPSSKIPDAQQQRDAEYHEGGWLRNDRDREIVEIREIGGVARGVVKTGQHRSGDGEGIDRRGQRYGCAVQEDRLRSRHSYQLSSQRNYGPPAACVRGQRRLVAANYWHFVSDGWLFAGADQRPREVIDIR
jgi:hypothetical protein